MGSASLRLCAKKIRKFPALFLAAHPANVRRIAQAETSIARRPLSAPDR
jgi:hypothetical protein